MDCAEFLRGLSDYRDGLIHDEAALVGFEVHRSECPRCARMVSALDVGLGALLDAGDPAPSREFRAGLERRLRAEVALGDPVIPTHAGLAAALLAVAAVGLLVYEGMTRQVGQTAAAEPIPAAAQFATSPRVPPLDDVTLPAFTHSEVEFHGQQVPLGTFAALTR